MVCSKNNNGSRRAINDEKRGRQLLCLGHANYVVQGSHKYFNNIRVPLWGLLNTGYTIEKEDSR